MSAEDPLRRLTLELARLPSIGRRSAARLAFYIVKKSQEGTGLAEDLAHALQDASRSLKLCETCQNFSHGLSCEICRRSRRTPKVLCVVESPADLRAIEESGTFHGRYFVLHGLLSPLDGIGPEELKLGLLAERLESEGIEEMVIATNPTVDGDATALYLAKLAERLGPKITRLASGIPMGGELEYLDTATLVRAFEDRRGFGSPHPSN